MTTYGTIPTGPTAQSRRDFIAQMKEHGRTALSLSIRRPWRELAPSIHAFGLPRPFSVAYNRIKVNLSHFVTNYVIIVLIIVFLSLIGDPISLLAFLFMMALWVFLFFLRDEPVTIMNREFSDRTVLFSLSVVTIVLLLFTGATTNIIVSVLTGIAVVLLHAVFRKTEDLDEGGAAATAGGWYAIPTAEEGATGRNPR